VPTGRLPGSRLAVVGLFALFIAFLAPKAAFAQDAPIRLALLPVGQPGSYFDLTMRPGETRRLAVDIANDGQAAIVARTYRADVYTIVNGGFGARLRDEPASGTTTWVTYPTTVLPLAVGEGIRRSFVVAVPADAGPGEYITSIVLENDAPLHKSGSVGLDQVIRQAVAVVVTVPGRRSPHLAVGAASNKIVADRSVVSVAVDNAGNVRLKPLVSFALLDAAGTEVSHASVQMDTFYARTSTFIEVALATSLPPGRYTVRLTVQDAARGLQAVTAAVPLIIGAPEMSPAASRAPGQTNLTPAANQAMPLAIVVGIVMLGGMAIGLILRLSRRGQPRPT
jgi:hypothetical protein